MMGFKSSSSDTITLTFILNDETIAIPRLRLRRSLRFLRNMSGWLGMIRLLKFERVRDGRIG
jgi:hypothetical protein